MSAEKEQRVLYIEQKSQSLQRSIESLKTFLNQEQPDAANAELRLKHIQNLFFGYTKNHEELLELKADSTRVAAFAQIESDFHALSAQVNKLKAPVPLAESTVLNATNVTFTGRRDLPKLPYSKIPKHDGRHESWPNWKNSFVPLVHNRDEITPYVKLTLLKDSVQGLLAQVIEEFEPSDANYPLAWEALCNAFDQKRVIVNEHLDKLMNLSPVTEAKADLFAGLMYTVRQNVKLLQTYKIELPDAYVIRLLELCLPHNVTSRRVDRLSGNELPKLQELYNHIQGEIFKRRQMDDLPKNPRANKKRPGDNYIYPPSKVQRTATRTFVTAAETSVTACIKCNQSHRLYACPEFANLKIKDKWDFVKTRNLCRNCLYAHPLPRTSSKRCKKCEKDHHTLLHSDKKLKNPKTESPQATKGSNQPKALVS